MPQTILITGTSSGYGKATAELFLSRGWNVIAAMRRPDQACFQGDDDRLRILPLDVTCEDSIARLVNAAGRVDVLVNNAGIGMVGAFEATPISVIRALFETNTFSVMAMCRAVVPQMRERRAGAIINVTSSATLAPFPLAASYTGSKQAIEGFTGSLALELRHFGIRTKLVEPGYGPTTRFAANAAVNPGDLIPQAYADFAAPIFESFGNPSVTTSEGDVAEAVWAAAHDETQKLRFAAGADAIALWKTRESA